MNTIEAFYNFYPMASKNKKKRIRLKRRRNTQKLTPEQLVVSAQKLFDKQKFRDARIIYNQLEHQFPGRYTGQIIACFRAQADLLAQRGQMEEARNILLKIKSISGTNGSSVDDVIFAWRNGQQNEALQICLKLTEKQWPSGDSNSDVRLADILVLGCSVPGRPSYNTPLLKDAEMVFTAFNRLCSKDYDSAWQMAGKLAYNSPFSHWKLFIKGLNAYYAGDDALALRAFKRIPQSSLLQKTILAFELLCSDEAGLDGHARDKDFAGLICKYGGHGEWSDALHRCEVLWRTGRFWDAYNHLVQNMPEFPSLQPGIRALLSYFFFAAIANHPPKALNRFANSLSSAKNRNGKPNPIQIFFSRKLRAIHRPSDAGDDHICLSWEMVLQSIPAEFGAPDKFKSEAYLHLGNMFSKPMPAESRGFYFRKPKNEELVYNARLAEKYLKLAAVHAPDDLDIHLAFISLYKAIKAKSKSIKTLDKAIKKFPENQTILKIAGNDCVSRKSYHKAAGYLKRALDKDPTDTKTQENYFQSLMRIAEGQFKKGATAKARASYNRILECKSGRRGDLNLDHAYIKARWSLLEKAYGDPQLGEELSEKITTGNGNDVVRIHYFMMLMAETYQLPGERKKAAVAAFNKKVPRRPSLALVVELVNVYTYFEHDERFLPNQKAVKGLSKLAGSCLKENIGKDDCQMLVLFFFKNNDSKMAQKFLSKGLRQNPSDTFFRFFKIILNMERRGRMPSYSEISQLKDLFEEAVRQKDERLIQIMGPILEEIQFVGKLADHDDDGFYDDDDDLDDYDDEIPPRSNLPIGELVNLIDKAMGLDADEEDDEFSEWDDCPFVTAPKRKHKPRKLK